MGHRYCGQRLCVQNGSAGNNPGGWEVLQARTTQGVVSAHWERDSVPHPDGTPGCRKPQTPDPAGESVRPGPGWCDAGHPGDAPRNEPGASLGPYEAGTAPARDVMDPKPITGASDLRRGLRAG